MFDDLIPPSQQNKTQNKTPVVKKSGSGMFDDLVPPSQQRINQTATPTVVPQTQISNQFVDQPNTVTYDLTANNKPKKERKTNILSNLWDSIKSDPMLLVGGIKPTQLFTSFYGGQEKAKNDPVYSKMLEARDLFDQKIKQPVLDSTVNTPISKKIIQDLSSATTGSGLIAPYVSIYEAQKPENKNKNFLDIYNDTLRGMKDKTQDVDNNFVEQILYGVAESGPQTLIGTALSLVPAVGPALSTTYFSAISANEQIQERGKVTSPINIGIDTFGDRMLGGTVEGLLKSGVNPLKKAGFKLSSKTLKDAGKGFITEGITEPSQTLLKYSNDYLQARTDDERAIVVEKATDYVKNGGLLLEMTVGGITGGLISGGASVLGSGPVEISKPPSEKLTVKSITKKDDKEFTEEQNKLRETIRNDIAEDIGDFKPVNEIASALQSNTGIPLDVATEIVNQVKEDTDVQIDTNDMDNAIQEALNEVKMTVEATSEASQDYMEGMLDKAFKGEIGQKLEEIKTLIAEKRDEGFSDFEIAQELQKKYDVSMDEAVAVVSQEAIKIAEVLEETKKADVKTEKTVVKPKQKDIEEQARSFKDVDDFIDAQGVPVLHGGSKSFEKFDFARAGTVTDTGMYGRGAYFTSSRGEAYGYSKGSGNIMEAYIDLKNPLRIRKGEDIPDLNVSKGDAKEYSDAFTKYLRDNGYDGVIDTMSGSGTQYMVLDAENIKTRKDLEDIFNKANDIKEKKEEVQKPKIISDNRTKAEENLAKIDKEVSKTDLKSEYFPMGKAGFDTNTKKQNQTIDKTIENAKKYNKAYEEVKTLNTVEKNYQKMFDEYQTVLKLIENKETSKGVKLSATEIKDFKKMAKDYEVRMGRLERQYKITRPQIESGSNNIAEAETTVQEKIPEIPATETKADSINSVETYNNFTKNLAEGTVTVEQFKQAYSEFIQNKEQIKADLMKMSKPTLLRNAIYSRTSDTKEKVANMVLSNMNGVFALGKPVSFTIGAGSSENSISKLVENTTAEDLASYAGERAKLKEERAKKMAEFKKATEDPQTLQDFKTFIEVNGKEAFTDQQRVKYDELVAFNQKEKESKQIKDAGVISGIKTDTKMTLEETTNTKTGEPLFKVKMSDRIAKDQYIALNNSAKKLGGYYSTYARGFLFKDRAMAENFMEVSSGKTIETGRVEEIVAEKKQNTGDKLIEMAIKLEETATLKLNQDRKANTVRRANMANSIEADARKDIALALTMKNLGLAIKDGDAKLLDKLTTKTQIVELDTLLASANYKQSREDSKNTGTFKTDIPIDSKTVDYVDTFTPNLWIKGVEETAQKGSTKSGIIKASKNVLKFVADAKAKGLETAIPNKAIMEDIITISDTIGDDTQWAVKDAVTRFKRLQSMGITSVEQLRATLREYIQFKETPVEANEIQKLEREIVGKKVGIDFFPTPSTVADQMVDMADIKEGMKVLEPSAGNGNIADSIRKIGVDPDVAEISSELRKILEAKGYNVVAFDFLKIKEKYDRIVMNPPFFNGMDAVHLQHAFDILNPGGKVISIIGEGSFIRSDKASVAFREWLDSVGATVEELPAGTFINDKLIVTTGANARMVEIYKPETAKFKINAEPVINLKKDVSITDVYGKKSVIPAGEALTPYQLGGSKVMLRDGQDYIVSKNQYQNVQNQSIKAEAKEFAPELKQTEETIKGGTDPFAGLTREDLEQELRDYDEDPTGMSINEMKQKLTEINEDDMGNAFNKEDGDTKYATYTLPGGENYKEILIQAPLKDEIIVGGFDDEGNIIDVPVKKGREYETAGFKSSHWDEQNVISHIRMNERTYNGKKVAFMEELQSDWAREARKMNEFTVEEKARLADYKKRGYGSLSNEELVDLNKLNHTAVPNNPLLKNWQELSIKRALQEAVNSNAKYFAWINGDQTSARYNLATQVDNVEWVEPAKGKGKVVSIRPTKAGGGIGSSIDINIDNSGTIIKADKGDWKGKKLDEVLGKGLADKIMSDEAGTLSGDGLKFGGEWANTLYDKQVGNIVKNLTGAKIETLDMGLPIDKNQQFFKIKIDGVIRDLNNLAFISPKDEVTIGRIGEGVDEYVVTDILGDGKFKAVRKNAFKEIPEFIAGKLKGEELRLAKELEESFDISKKQATQQAIELTPEVKAIINGEAPQLKQPSGRPLEAFKVGSIESPVWDRTIDEIQQGLSSIFGKNVPISEVLNAERDLKNPYALARALKSGIDLLSVNETFSEAIANHEGWHWFKMQLSFKEQSEISLIEAEFAKQNIEKVKKLREFYSESEINEELMADTFAEYTKTGKTFSQKIKTWFDKAILKLKLLFSGRSDVLKLFRNVQSMLNESEGNNMPIKEGKFKIGPDPKFDTGDNVYNGQLDFEKKEEGNLKQPIRKISVSGVKIPLSPELEQQAMAMDFEQEVLDESPLNKLWKYANKKEGTLPEAGGTRDGGIFARIGDDIVSRDDFMRFADNDGSIDSEVIREEFQKHFERKQDLKKRREQHKKEVKAYIAQQKDSIAVQKLAEQAEKKEMAEIKAREAKARKDEIKKLLDQKDAELKIEKIKQEDRKTLIQKINATPTQELTTWQRLVGQKLNPLRFTDKVTQNIFKSWSSKTLSGRIRANKEAATFLNIPAEKGFDTILKYEAGVETPYSAQIKTKFDALREEARSRGIDMGFRENYLPHVYKENTKEIKEKIAKYLKDKGMSEEMINEYMNGQKLSPTVVKMLKINAFFSKERIFPTYKVAMEYGLTPKYTQPAQLVGHYIQEMETIVANNDLVKELDETGKILPFEDAPLESWDHINLPFNQKGYMASPAVANVINGLFGKQEATGWTYLANISKKMQEIRLSAGVPYTTINFFAIGQVVKEMTKGNIKVINAFLRANFNQKSADWMRENREYLYMMARQGIDLRQTVDSFENMHSMIKEIPGFWGKAGEIFDQALNRKTFNSFMPMMQTQLFKDIYDSFIKKGYPKNIAEEYAGAVIANNFGITKFNARSKKVRDVLSAIFFAPQFREGIINTLYRTGLSGVDAVKNVGGMRGQLDPTLKENRKLLVGMIVTYALYNVLNAILNDDEDDENGYEFMWNNPKNRQFALRIPTAEGDILYVEFMPSFLAFARNMASGAINLATGDLQGSSQKFGSVFSMPIKLTTEVLSNRDYWGNEIYKDTDTGTQKALKLAEYTGLAVNHPFIEQAMLYIQDKKPGYQALITSAELPVKFSSLEKEAKSDYYDALDRKAKENARIRNKVKPIYDKVQKLKVEGNLEEANKLYEGLTEEEKIMYSNIRQSPYEKAVERNEMFEEAIKSNKSSGQIYKEIAMTIYGNNPTTSQKTLVIKDFEFYKEYNNYKYKAEAKELNGLSNVNKVLYLRSLQKKLTPEEYKEFISKGRRKIRLASGALSPILISDEVLKEIR